MQRLAEQGVDAVDVFCPGFAADCLETLEEISMQNRDIFIKAGGRSFRYIPALNDSAAHLDCLSGLIEKHSRGWDNFGHDPRSEEQRAAVRERAMKMGAEKSG